MKNLQRHINKVIINEKNMKSEFIKSFKEYLNSHSAEFFGKGCKRALICVAIESLDEDTGNGESCISLMGDAKLLTETIVLLLDNDQVFNIFEEQFFNRMAQKIYEEEVIMNGIQDQLPN